MRRLVVTLLVLAAAVALLDVGLRAFAQYWVGRELQESLAVEDRPSVSLGGFPFLAHLASGRFTEVDVEARGLREGDVRVSRIVVRLDEVTIPRGQLLSGREGPIHAASGSGTARFTGEDVTAAVRGQGVPITVRFEGGEVVVGVEELGVEGRADLALDGRTVVLTPTGVPVEVSYAIRLPRFVPGIRYSDVRVEGDELVIEVRFDDVTFAVP